jgi:hypothetical protein
MVSPPRAAAAARRAMQPARAGAGGSRGSRRWTDLLAALCPGGRALGVTISMPFRTTVNRRIRALSAHLIAAAAEELPQVGSGPGGQGFGPRASQQPPKFDPTDPEAAAEFFNAEGYCVVENVLTEAEIQQLHRWLDDRRDEGNEPYPDGILGPYSGNVLLREDAEELDRFTRLPTLLPFVDTLWGEGNSRFAQFDFRWTEAKEGPGTMHFHHDATLPQRLSREPYGQPDWICSIIYLTEVDANSPSFAVVPKSVRYEPITQAKVELGDEYIEQPLYGKAGTAVWYDTVRSHVQLPSSKPSDRAAFDPFSTTGYLPHPSGLVERRQRAADVASVLEPRRLFSG